jgi:predicted nucleotidyltransferase
LNEKHQSNLTAKEHQAIETFLDQLHQRYPGQILQTVLFGSKARGDSSPYSDIDILIIVEEESWPLRGEISTIAARVSLEYDVLIGPRVIGRERWESMKHRRFSLFRNIAAEGIPLTPEPV